MRKVIYIFAFLLLVTSNAFGQNIERRYGANLDFYVGTWKYTNIATNEEFTIKLRKSIYTGFNISYDCVVGTYTYKKNGSVILDNMNEFMIDRSVGLPAPIYASNARETISEPNPNKLRTFVDDYGILWPNSTLPKDGEGTITIVSTVNPKKIRWELKDGEGPRIVGHHPPMGFSIPTDIILTKVE